MAQIELQLVDPSSGKNIQEAGIEVLVAGQAINSFQMSYGHLSFSMPINAWIRINVDGLPEIRRSLYLDYLPHRNLLQNLASGDWRNQLQDGQLYSSGEVLWEAFNFSKTKEVLSHIDWQIQLIPNDRDAQWESFDVLF